MKRKYIIGIAVLVALLCLGLVMCSMFDGSDNDYYEGETVPIEIGEDIFDDEQEDSTSESGADESDTSESDNGKSNTDKSNGAENTADGKDADEKDKTESSDDTKDEEEGGNADLDEGWSPFY